MTPLRRYIRPLSPPRREARRDWIDAILGGLFLAIITYGLTLAAGVMQ